MLNPQQVFCECGRHAKLVDLGGRKSWHCEVCNAWVEVKAHSSTHAPKGRLTDGQLHYWKNRARDAFNLLWVPMASETSDKATSRGIRAKAYKWLATQLGVEAGGLHFDNLTLEQCQRIYAICDLTPPDYFRR